MQVDDPPYLSVGTAVSAKYKGAFCEAKVSKVDRLVKCKVTFKSGLGATTVSDNEIKGTLRVGHQVLVKHSEHKEPVEATITKIQDCSQYTVVFDDGDITTLRRTALCLKSGRHFNESETLDQLPLTHPEHFSIPVMGGRRGRRNRLLKDESSDEDVEEEDEPDLEGYSQDIGRVVSVETGESKRGKEKWFPGLIVIPSAQPTVKINIKDEFLIRSFRDDRYYTVPKKEVSEFHRDLTEKIDSSGLLEAIQKANKYLNSHDLPLHWEKSSLFNIAGDSDSDDNVSDESGEEQSEEKDLFVAQLYKFMDDAGTPLNKTPTIAGKDIDLHRLFRVVDKMGGYNRVTNQNKWKSVVGKMKVPISQNASNQIKSVYKKCLLSYEGFFRTLGVTMSNPIKPNKKDKGRSLIRDKDRTPMSSPRPEREDDIQEKPVERKPTPVPEKPELKTKKKSESTPKEVKEVPPKKLETSLEVPGTSSAIRPKRHETPKSTVKEVKKQIKPTTGDKVKVLVEKFEDAVKRDKEEKIQFTRSKSLTSVKPVKDMVTTRQSKEAPTALAKAQVLKPSKKVTPLKEEEEKDKKPKSKKKLESSDFEPPNTANIGDKLIVYYGPTNESKVTYEAKVVDIDKESPQTGTIYLVHYTGWNTRYDEWIPASRIAENLTSGSKSKKAGKVPAPVNVKQSTSSNASTSGMKTAAKRARLSSVSSKEEKPPRSTTPSSVTSSGSVSKSPATPVVRSSRLAAKQEAKRRRVSAQTDVSDIDSSESEPELSRTRSGSIKSEELEVKVYRKRVSRGPPISKTPTPKRIKKEDEEDFNKDDDSSEKSGKEKRLRNLKKSSPDESEDDESESGSSEARGRDFDLNQIRSELKGFAKALKAPTVEVSKDSSSSEDSSEKPPELIKEELKKEMTVEVKKLEEEDMKPLPPKLEVSSSSDDIYEFKEPEPFEFESRSKLGEDKGGKKRLPRLFGSLSPSKNESKLDLPEPRTYSRIPKRVQVSEDEEEDEIEGDLMEEEETAGIDVKNEDPFDKLIESPSFNLMKGSGASPVDDEAESLKDVQTKPGSFHDNLFKEPETSDEYSRDMELSDCEFPTQIFTREDTVFSAAFSKSPNDRTTPDFSSSKTDEGKTTTNSDDEDIQAQIQRVIAQSSSTDDDSGDVLINVPSTSKKVEVERNSPAKPATLLSTTTTIHQKIITVLGQPLATPVQVEIENKETTTLPVAAVEDNCAPPKEDKVTTEQPLSPKKPIDPALQETDSSLLESIVSKPPLILNPKLDDTGKELTVKTGTRIADSILQKFNSIKNNIDLAKTSTSAVNKPEPVKVNVVNEPGPSKEVQITKEESKDAKNQEDEKPEVAMLEEKSESMEPRRRRRVVSKAIIEESDSDSSDSEHLVIGSEDEEDSRTNSSDNKPLIECKNTDSNMSLQKTITTTDDSQSQPAVEEKRSFSFDDILPKEQAIEETPIEVVKTAQVEVKESESVKTEEKAKDETKEEQDPNLHSLLLCEEEIPRSPAPVAELPCCSDAPSVSSVHEMPFASAPGTSNSNNILLEPVKKQPPPPLLMHVVEKENRADAQVVIENTPPTTPESTISNLSPRGDNGTTSTPNASPNSNEDNAYFPNHRASSSGMGMKISPYSEEDTQPGGELRKQSDVFGGPPMVYRKRRRSLRNSEDGPAPMKRGRKARRRDSDSDASESSAGGGTTPGGSMAGGYERSARSPRPSKYNFFVEFDPSLDSSQRIAVLQQKLSELRKAYADVKAELATVERRRKKLRRREREALKTSKQEMVCS